MRTKRSILLLLVAVLALVVAACGNGDGDTEAGGPLEEETLQSPGGIAGDEVTPPPAGQDTTSPGAGEPVVVILDEQNGSGITGTAELTSTEDGDTRVLLRLENATGVHPVHIHDGTCENLGDIAYPLTNVSEGESETQVDVSLEELQSGQFAINAHESAQNIQNYIACGNINEQQQ